jgi:hypothetical protein
LSVPVRFLSTGAGLLAALCASPALAGPPYQTDDPEPTALRHWEIYAFVTADGRSSDLEGAAGFDLNYGAAKELQLTATLPLAFEDTTGSGWRSGSGDVELGAKYRFVNDEKRGFQAAVFPRVILPTSDRDLGGHRVRLLLPLWLQKDFGATSLFGGGGYEINPGVGNRDFWQAGLAVTHDFSDRLSLGTELTWQSADTRGGKNSTGVNLGLIRKLGGPYSLLLAGGPSFSGGQTSYHSYAALALSF